MATLNVAGKTCEDEIGKGEAYNMKSDHEKGEEDEFILHSFI